MFKTRISLTFIALFLASAFCFAQHAVVETASLFIQKKDYTGANTYLDSILKKDKKNVDALMMKGNVILNKKWDESPTPLPLSADNETVFDTSFASLRATPPVIPQAIADEVEAYWFKCLNIDSNRLDIIKGLCSLYAISLQKEKLEKEITVLFRHQKDTTGEQAYNMAEYARKLKERERFDDAMEAYAFIAHLYPGLAGIRADIGAEYFYTGHMKEALSWLDSATGKKNIDETTYLNTAFIYSNLGYYDNCQMILERYDREYQRSMATFYSGLRLFADSNERYADKLQSFIQSTDSNSYYSEHQLAHQLLACKDSFTLGQLKMITASNNSPWYLPLVMQRGMMQFKEQCQPYLIYGVYNGSIKNYGPAVQLLEEGENCRMTPAESTYWMLTYAYCLYKTGNAAKSDLYFQPLTATNDVCYKQAALYFLARNRAAAGDKDNARKLLASITGMPQQSKYSYLAEAFMQQLAK